MKTFLTCILVAAMIALAGCSTQALDPAIHTRVLVYPLMDLRTNKSFDLKYKAEKYAKTKVNDILRFRYYYIPQSLANPSLANVTYAQIQDPNPASLKAVESQGSRYVLIIVVKEFGADGIFNMKANFEGYMIDKQQGQIIWKNYASDSDWASGDLLLNTIDKLLDRIPMLSPDNSTGQVGTL